MRRAMFSGGPENVARRIKVSPKRASATSSTSCASCTSYGVYQIGDVYARSCVVIGTSGVIFTP